MNKYITMLLLGVIVAAMVLVLGVHMKEYSGGQDAAPAVAVKSDGAGQPSGTAGGRIEPSQPSVARPTASTPPRPGETAAGREQDDAGTLALNGRQTPAVQSDIPQAAADSAAQTRAEQDSVPVASRTETDTQGASPAQTAQQPESPPAGRPAGQTADQAAGQATGQTAGPTGAQTAERGAQTTAATQASEQSGSRPASPPAADTQTAARATPQAEQRAAAVEQAAPQEQQPPARTQVAQAASVPRGQGNITNMEIKFRGKGLYLSIEADGPLPARYFVLPSPERLVVDLPGTWKNIKMPAVPQNLLVKSIRQGRQKDADRLVLDLNAKLKAHSLVRISDNKIEVVFE